MNNSHVLDVKFTDEDADNLIKTGIPFEVWEKEISEPDPWYVDLFNLFRYRIPYKIESFFDDLWTDWQRSQHGYADGDVWNMYVHIADLMDRMTIELVAQTHGHPPDLDMTEWRTILHKIRSAFAKIGERDDKGEFMTDEDMKELDEAFDLLKKYFIFMWD